MGFTDFFRKKTNVDRGKEIEKQFEAEQAWSGKKLKRTGRGSDYKTINRDIFTGKKNIEYWEVKRNNSRLSKLQKKTKNLKVYRARDTPLGNEVTVEDKRGNRLVKDWSGKWQKEKKNNENSWFGSNNSTKKKKTKQNDSLSKMFGSSSSGGRKKSSDSFGSMFGSSSSGGRKKSSDSFGSMFGSSSSKRSRKSNSFGF